MTENRHTGALPRFQPNAPKILEVVIFLIEEAARRGIEVTQYDIVKSVFLGDKRHLDEFGRPITFDNYVAMEHGPVPSATYDILKPNYDWGLMGLPSAPWTRTIRPGGNAAVYSRAKRSANEKLLSVTDANALRDALALVKSLNFGGVREFTHRNRAYEAAWKPAEGAAFEMDYRLIGDFADEELIADLEYASYRLA